MSLNLVKEVIGFDMNKAKDIELALMSMADESHAIQIRRFFKTGIGEYGEGDKFLGLRNPQVRMVVKEAWKQTLLDEAVRLVRSEWHEVRLCGLLIMVEHFLKAMKMGDKKYMDKIFRTYISLHRHINNWDLVDLSAIKIVGNYEVLFPGISIMDEWIEPEGHTLWQQRISMVSTWISIRHGNATLCFKRASKLLSSGHDLLHKAAGWMLREAWKKGYQDEVDEFLTQNISGIPSIMLSYACEKMSEPQRHKWQQLRREHKQ